MVELFAMLGAAFLLSQGIMLVAWVIYFFQRKANIVDVGWAVAFFASAWGYFLLGHGFGQKRLLITLMVSIWAVRLCKHLLERLFKSPEDGRYVEMRKRWGGDRGNVVFLMMFLLQGSLTVILSLPFLIVAYGATPEWTAWELFGFLVWILGVAGESLADFQLSVFKSDPANRDKVLKTGLWRFSRHPNYFFEFVVWVGFALFAFATPGGSIGLLSPIIMYTLLTSGSGVPLNEEQALLSKGDDYREYQRTTNPFFPWFPKSDPLIGDPPTQ